MCGWKWLKMHQVVNYGKGVWCASVVMHDAFIIQDVSTLSLIHWLMVNYVAVRTIAFVDKNIQPKKHSPNIMLEEIFMIVDDGLYYRKRYLLWVWGTRNFCICMGDRFEINIIIFIAHFHCCYTNLEKTIFPNILICTL